MGRIAAESVDFEQVRVKTRDPRALLGVHGDVRVIEQDAIAKERRRGRGAAGNKSGRFENETRVETNTGWDTLDELEALRTEVHVERARNIITRNDSPDIPFDRSINPYRGC